jgi:hypothetical protein
MLPMQFALVISWPYLPVPFSLGKIINYLKIATYIGSLVILEPFP